MLVLIFEQIATHYSVEQSSLLSIVKRNCLKQWQMFFSYHSKTVKAGISTCAYFGTPFINKLLFTMQYLDKKRRNLKLTIYIDILLSPLLTW